MRSWFILAGLCVAGSAQAAPLLFDMGTAKSEVWQGFTRVTAQSAWSEAAGFGWQSPDGMKEFAKAYTTLVENKSTGTQDPPPIWTNPITEDGIAGERESTFLIKAPPGAYNVYVVCGASDGFRSQYFDFDVSVGNQSQRQQIEGHQRFFSLTSRANVGQEPLAVKFSPRSKWVVNAILVFSDADAAQVRKEILTPFEEWTYRLPPDEWAKWKEDPEPDPGPEPAWSAADRQRGFAVYSRPYLEPVYPHARPRPEELNPELRLFATQGEYEPCNFIIHPLKDLANARVTVSDIGPIPAKSVDVRYVRFTRARPNYSTMYRYRVVPDALQPCATALDLKAGENTRYWLTLHVPETAKAGTYAGKVTFQCAGGSVEVPIRLRVLPFRLREDPSKIYGIYYRHPYDEVSRATDEVSKEYFRRKAELEHQDMVAHGTRNVTFSIWSPAANAEGKFDFKWDVLAAKVELWRKYNFQGPMVMGIPSTEVYEKYMKARPGSHLRGIKDPPEEFCREITAMVRTIEAERQARGWPEFLYYPVDEPSGDDAAVNFMVKVLKACKDAGVRTYVTADPTHEAFEPMRPYVDVWCCQPFAPGRDAVVADMKARKVEYWCYPNHVSGENDHTPVAGGRMTYGFGFWRSGFVALIPWIYSSSVGSPHNYLDGRYQDFFVRHEPDGTPVPVALWEGFREGYDDYRYIYTLRQVIAEAKAGGRPAAVKAAAQAEKELQFVWDSIRVQPKYKHDDLWSPAEFDVYRWIVARQILAVLEAK